VKGRLDDAVTTGRLTWRHWHTSWALPLAGPRHWPLGPPEGRATWPWCGDGGGGGRRVL